MSRENGRCHTGGVTYDDGNAWACRRLGKTCDCHTSGVTYEESSCRECDCHTGDVTYEDGDAWGDRCLGKSCVVTPEV